MKKTILSLCLAAASTSAFAAQTTSIELPVSADLYGKVGVSADFLDYADEKVDDLNLVRNTEIGVMGGADLNEQFKVKYDVRVGFEDKDKHTTESDYVVDLTRANATLVHSKFFVTAGLAESGYDNATRKFDVFANTFTSDWELFDSVDTAEAIAIGLTPVENLTLGFEVSGEEIADTAAFTAAFAIEGVDLAAAYTATDIKEGDDTEAFKFGAGYGFQHIDSALTNGLYVGLIHEKHEDNVSTVKSSTTSFTAEKALNETVEIAIGYAVTDLGIKGQDDVTSYRVAADFHVTSNIVATTGYARHEQDKTDESIFTAGVIYNF